MFLFQPWANQVSGVPGLNAPKPAVVELREETNYVTVYCATERKPYATLSNVMVSVMWLLQY